MYELALAIIAINFIGFAMMVWDKHCAETGQRRVRESTLLRLALFGGSIGVMAARTLARHKTGKEPFRTHLFLVIVLQLAALVGVVVYRASWSIGSFPALSRQAPDNR